MFEPCVLPPHLRIESLPFPQPYRRNLWRWCRWHHRIWVNLGFQSLVPELLTSIFYYEIGYSDMIFDTYHLLLFPSGMCLACLCAGLPKMSGYLVLSASCSDFDSTSCSDCNGIIDCCVQSFIRPWVHLNALICIYRMGFLRNSFWWHYFHLL